MVGLPGGFAAELGWIPPVEVNGVETNLLSLALERPLLERERFALGLRGSWATGRSTGDFTCWEEVASQPPGEGNPYGCLEPSHDTYEMQMAGLAVTGGVTLGSSGTFHFAVGASHNDLGSRSTL
jgi:hypothetical protein